MQPNAVLDEVGVQPARQHVRGFNNEELALAVPDTDPRVFVLARGLEEDRRRQPFVIDGITILEVAREVCGGTGLRQLDCEARGMTSDVGLSPRR